ncbi:MAG TPA: hypothetical protein PKC14_04940 [Candidatus Absconditabacterales bacterium]|nr:hypothetical protein [Candidatus Absconditabacterales bacterium]
MNNKNYNTDQDISRAKEIVKVFGKNLKKLSPHQVLCFDENCRESVSHFDNVDYANLDITKLSSTISIFQASFEFEDIVKRYMKESEDADSLDSIDICTNGFVIYHNHIVIKNFYRESEDDWYGYILKEIDLFEILFEWLIISCDLLAKSSNSPKSLIKIFKKIDQIFEKKYGPPINLLESNDF